MKVLKATPDNELVKEVFARFGLCMYLTQSFETGLVNTLTALNFEKSRTRTAEIFESLFRKNETLTFGNLVNSLHSFDFIPAEIIQECRKLKAERDNLAHQFFRDHLLDLMTVGGCHSLIDALDLRITRLETLDNKLSEYQDEAYARLGFSASEYEKMIPRVLSDMRKEAESRYDR